jgi:hypothetical protein
MWSTITNLFSTPPSAQEQSQDTNHDRLDDEDELQIEQSTFFPMQRRLSAANLMSSNGQVEEAYDPRQVTHTLFIICAKLLAILSLDGRHWQ